MAFDLAAAYALTRVEHRRTVVGTGTEHVHNIE
jgi:hypothetical protein